MAALPAASSEARGWPSAVLALSAARARPARPAPPPALLRPAGGARGRLVTPVAALTGGQLLDLRVSAQVALERGLATTSTVAGATAAFVGLGMTVAFVASALAHVDRGGRPSGRRLLWAATFAACSPQVVVPCYLMGVCAGILVARGVPPEVAAPAGAVSGAILYVLALEG